MTQQRSVMELRQLQQSFYGQLRGTVQGIQKHIQSTPERSAEQRLHIYSSGYRLRLKEAISTDFEQLNRYMGEDLFEKLMDAYIDKYQSRHTSLRYYSQHMIGLLSSLKPFADYPVLTEIAQIEQAFNDSFDAADCSTIAMRKISEILPDDWVSMRLRFHASVQFLALKTNSFAVWKAVSEEQVPPDSAEQASTWIIWRKDLVSRYRSLSEPENQVLKRAMGGANFAELCEAMLDFVGEEQLALQVMRYLQNWISDKMICDISGGLPDLAQGITAG